MLIFVLRRGVGCFGFRCFGGNLLNFVLSRGVGCFAFRRFGSILLIFVLSGGVGYLGSVVFVLLC